ncbi:hypothetical protein PIROE2DRAFT_63170 [Piromyces sp. E2]|nr:hypothetical protein PIROE2DRAFT_63170 [Piromyces sp. E2]|eukprot:OUM60415.1 hypothetical protein PIROE2DRAFT_63170 [Piromyces sp. E2]
MLEKIYETESGNIYYWVNNNNTSNISLILLPGLGFDHRLYDKQVEFFQDKYNILVWDAPGHASSYPFNFNFSMMDEAKWLNEIITIENLNNLIFVGQSMGGYIAQAYLQMYPEKAIGFISIDSSSLKRKYVNPVELFLNRWLITPIYKWIPWDARVNLDAESMSNSKYGKQLILDIMFVYDEDRESFDDLFEHGNKIIIDSYEADLPYDINCPTLLICGEKDSTYIKQNQEWSKDTGFKLEMIENASNISNADNPEIVNSLVDNFVKSIMI